MLRAGALTEVHPPTPEEESVRDLCRWRDDIREDLIRSRHRLGKMLLRRGWIYPGKAWNDQRRQWLRNLALEHDADRVVFDDCGRWNISRRGCARSRSRSKRRAIASFIENRRRRFHSR
jgi:hypothetical protein